jgi:hypothetical protein
VNVALAQRQIALAGLALLAGIVALALGSQDQSSAAPQLPDSIPAPGGGWYQATATSRGPTFERSHLDGACGNVVGPKSDDGVASATLPCASTIYIQFGDKLALTRVIARGSSSAAADFEIPPPLAGQLGLEGNELVDWRYAR